MARRHQKWSAGDIFAMPLPDGRLTLGQVISAEPDCMNSALCAFFTTVVHDTAAHVTKLPSPEDLATVQLVTRESLDRHDWTVVGHAETFDTSVLYPMQALRDAGYVGAKIQGSAIIDAFMAAMFGLEAWDQYHDPGYFDTLLMGSARRPGHAVFSKR